MAKGAAQFYGKNVVKVANRQARNAVNAARKPIKADQAAARAALQGFGVAAGKLLTGIGPADQQAYHQATTDEAALAQGFSGQTRDQVQQAQQANDQFRQQMAPGSDSQEQVNPADLGNALYDQAGYIPGSSLASQGAAAGAWGNAQPAIQEARTEGDIQASDANYAKQLLSIAAQEPQLRQQAMSALYDTELKNQAAQLAGAKFGEQQRSDTARIRQGNARVRQGQARIQQGRVRLQIEGESVALRQQSQKLAIQKAQQQGRQVDMNTSKARGYYVDNNGNPIKTKNGKNIPYQGTASSKGTGKNGTGPGSTEYKEAYRYAASNYATQYISPGVADPTQSRPPFVQMQQYLVKAYGVTRGQARKILVAQGIKPDGKRPKK